MSGQHALFPRSCAVGLMWALPVWWASVWSEVASAGLSAVYLMGQIHVSNTDGGGSPLQAPVPREGDAVAKAGGARPPPHWFGFPASPTVHFLLPGALPKG